MNSHTHINKDRFYEKNLPIYEYSLTDKSEKTLIDKYNTLTGFYFVMQNYLKIITMNAPVSPLKENEYPISMMIPLRNTLNSILLDSESH